jgi:transketolase
MALMTQDTPSVLALTRQGLPLLNDNRKGNMVSKGAYVLRENGSGSQVALFASGSEVEIAHKAYEQLAAKGVKVRLVSVPCMDLFWQQDPAYIKATIGTAPVKVAIEAGVKQGWEAFIGTEGAFIGMNSFGASAPYQKLYEHFGITVDAVMAAVEKLSGK